MVKWEIGSGILLLLFSIYIAQLPHYSFFLVMIIGWLFLVDGLHFIHFKESVLTSSFRKIFIIFVLGGGFLYGGVLEGGNLLAGTLWSYNQVDVITLFLAHMFTLPTAFLTFRLLSASLHVEERKKKNYKNKYIPIFIGTLFIFGGAFIPAPKVITYALFMVGYVLLIEFLVLLRKRHTFIERLVSNPKLFIPVVMQALLSGLLVEGANTLAGAWTYHVLTYTIFGLSPFILVGWIPLIIGLQSLFELVK